jgi:hypothetical protein
MILLLDQEIVVFSCGANRFRKATPDPGWSKLYDRLESPSAFLSAETWTLRFPSSTKLSGQSLHQFIFHDPSALFN